jgi:hypothetical protein
MTYDGSATTAGIKLYVNGSLFASNGSMVGSYTHMIASTVPVLIGSFTPNNNNYKQFINGSIDDVRVYNRALSASEIRAIYQGEQ